MIRIIAVTPAHICDPTIAVAACRAGEIGVLDLGFRNDNSNQQASLEMLAKHTAGADRWGVRWDALGDASRSLAGLAEILTEKVPILILAGIPKKAFVQSLSEARRFGIRVFLEITSLDQAKAAQDAGYDGLIVKGFESGGRVGKLGSFVFLQLLHNKITIPYWIQGGIGLHTAAAAIQAGASGVVLCEQLWMTDEAPFPQSAHELFGRLDGSESICIGPNDALFRCYSYSGRAALREAESKLAGECGASEISYSPILLSSDGAIIPMGQDIALARLFAKRFGTVGRVITAIKRSALEHNTLAVRNTFLTPNSPLAKAHGTLYPIAQGPMARVSDVASFSKAVASAGGLPFLALSMMKGAEVRAMLSQALEHMNGMPWGVGILGFLPQEMRKDQIEVLRDIKPPFAVIAGGRPNQALEFESMGISSYLHIPSTGMLEMALNQGVRKFIFEGNECGGHIGPRTSFILWESAITTILESGIKNPGEVQIMFAGGVHDAFSAAMITNMAAPLANLGVKIGVLMGTAYLFTHEIIESGAILPAYQRQALACDTTIVLQSGVGHASRCVLNPYAEEFVKIKEELVRAGKTDEEIRLELETLNLGRLRIASKGVVRSEKHGVKEGGCVLEIDEQAQQREGMYMIGQVAELRSAPLSIAELHADVSEKSLTHLEALHEFSSEKEPDRTVSQEAIAIVGMAGMFPGASNIREYWHNILNGVNAVQEVNSDRWNPGDLFSGNRMDSEKTYSKWGGFLKDIAFNPVKYGIPPASLRSIDPVQLLALEAASRALEDAGYDKRSFNRERTAVIFGAGGPNDRSVDYGLRSAITQHLPQIEEIPPDVRKEVIRSLHKKLPEWTEDSFPGFLDNIISGRISNRLNLGGTNHTVNAACATSFAALEVALNQLQTNTCDVAIVGAADTNNNILAYISFSRVQAMSPTGKSRPFDESADGMVLGEGVGAVVLRRLSDAERDGDHIYAVIKGIGSSSDGRNRSLTAPHPSGQARALERAFKNSGVSPDTMQLVECHGTGTPVGDAAEVKSLKEAFEKNGSTDRHQYCAVGSVKSMIGHTKVAAGMAGLIKCILALKHKMLPPTIGIEKPTSAIDFSQSPFYLITESRPWLKNGDGGPRRAGLSSFGFGGTNFHVVLEAYEGDLRKRSRMDLSPRDAEVVTISGATRAEVGEAVRRLAQELEKSPVSDLPQLAYSIFIDEQMRRRPGVTMPCRLSVVAGSISDLKRKIDIALSEIPGNRNIKNPIGIYYSEEDPVEGGVCFLFPGQGAQRVNMLKDLVMGMPATYSLIERADEILKGKLKKPLSHYIYPIPVFSQEERNRQQEELNDSHVAQPAIGLMDIIAMDILAMYGMKPDFAAGHSYGENIALCAAGAISREEVLYYSEVRGRIVNEVSAINPGAMAAVRTNGKVTQTVLSELGSGLYLANLNSPEQTVVAGTISAIEDAVKTFNSKGIRAKKIPVTAAFHSPLVNRACEAMALELANVHFKPPQIKVFSNTTASLYPETPDEIRSLLVKHLGLPVHFDKQILAMYKAGAKVFIEAGPGRILTSLVEGILDNESYTALTLDVPGRSGWLQLAHLLAQAGAVGLPVNLEPWFDGRRLEKVGVDEALKKARTNAGHGSHIWRVDGGRAVPWNEAAMPKPVKLNAAGADKRPSEPLPLAGSPIMDAAAKSQPKEERKSIMKSPLETGNPQEHHEANTVNQSNAAVLVPHFQSTLSQFIELQREQQKVMHRFFDIQEGLLQACLRNGGEAPSIEIPQANLQRQAEAAAVTTGVAPAPIIPNLPFHQIEAAQTPAPQPASSVRPPAPAITIPDLTPRDVAENRVQATTIPETDSPSGDQEAVPTKEQFQEHLVRLVSERTGYPPEMLDVDLHMESDLGIDSIKKIEIFAGMKDQYQVMRNLDEESLLEQMASLTTLRSIVEWYDSSRSKMLEASSPPASPPQTPLVTQSVQESPIPKPMPMAPRIITHRSNASPAVELAVESIEKVEPIPAPLQPSINSESLLLDPVKRLILKPVAQPIDDAAEIKAFPHDYTLLLIGRANDEITSMLTSLTAGDHKIVRLTHGSTLQVLDDDRYEADLSSLETIQELRSTLMERGNRVGAIINLTSLAEKSDALTESDCTDDIKHLFMMLKVFGDDLLSSVEAGAGWLVNFTAMDGQFGLKGKGSFSPGQAGSVGIMKTVAREWPSIKVKSVDLDPEADPQVLATKVLQELALFDDLVEVGLDEEGRWRIDLEESDPFSKVRSLRLIDEQSVLLVTGGAYGITSEVTKALASRYQPRIILVGRSPLPEDENPEIQGLQGSQDLRQYFIRTAKQEKKPVTPAAIEKQVLQILKARGIRRNIEEMTTAGATVEYRALDVRNADHFGALLDSIYEKYGRIDGVIHGAGVNEDKLIKDKSMESFNKVLETKIIPAKVLAERLHPEGLKFMVFFSSVAGRFGNVGQSDYSAANEVLNKLAVHLASSWPAHVTAINWGPWESGMVTEDLSKLFAERGIHLIPTAEGVRMFLDELHNSGGCTPEVVISRSVKEISETRV